MGNKPAKPDIFPVMEPPPLDDVRLRRLAKDLARIHKFVPKDPPALTPPDHYIEYMRFKGWLDLDMDDPDLAHLFK